MIDKKNNKEIPIAGGVDTVRAVDNANITLTNTALGFYSADNAMNVYYLLVK